MFNKSAVVAVICAWVVVSSGAAGAMERTAFAAANGLAAGKAGFSRPLTVRDAQSSACKRCNDALERCERNPPYGNPRVCASDYYDCIKGKKCE